MYVLPKGKIVESKSDLYARFRGVCSQAMHSLKNIY